MDEATLDHLFDPFFTTKDVGKGTGLGLSTVYGLIGQSGGTITVESVLTQGTTFTILLPKVGASFEGPFKPSVGMPSSSEVAVVLMVEDEPSVREFARRVLERAGHTVITAASGDQALRAADAWQGTIDVLLTDVVMPGMPGQTVAASLLKVMPDIRVIFMSGYAEEAIPELGRLSTPSAFLAKPFSAATLGQAVAREIARARAVREQ
jgi:CheY-like chemotaxis protein